MSTKTKLQPFHHSLVFCIFFAVFVLAFVDLGDVVAQTPAKDLKDLPTWNDLPKDEQRKIRKAIEATRGRASRTNLVQHYRLLNEYGSLEKPGIFQVHYHLAYSEFRREWNSADGRKTIMDPLTGTDFEYVFKHLEHCLAIDPESERAWLLQGRAASAVDDKPKAIASFQELYRLQPLYFFHLYHENKRQGLVEENKRLVNDSNEQLVASFDKDIKDESQLFLCGTAWSQLGNLLDDPAVAIEKLEKLVRLQGQQSQLRRWLDLLYIKKAQLMPDVASKLDWLEKADPKVAASSVVEIVLRNDEFRDRALKIYDPDSPKTGSSPILNVAARKMLVDAAEKEGDFETALSWLPGLSQPNWNVNSKQHSTLNRICRLHLATKNEANRRNAIKTIERMFFGPRDRHGQIPREPNKPVEVNHDLLVTYGLLLVADGRHAKAATIFRESLANPEKLTQESYKQEAQQALEECKKEIRTRLDQYRQQLKNVEDQ